MKQPAHCKQGTWERKHGHHACKRNITGEGERDSKHNRAHHYRLWTEHKKHSGQGGNAFSAFESGQKRPHMTYDGGNPDEQLHTELDVGRMSRQPVPNGPDG